MYQLSAFNWNTEASFCEAQGKGKGRLVKAIRSLKVTQMSLNFNFSLELTIKRAVQNGRFLCPSLRRNYQHK